MEKVITLIKKIAARFTQDNITVYSAQAAYFVVVSMIPFVMLLVSLIRFLIPDNQETLMNTIVILLPGDLGSFAKKIINELFNTPTSSVISLSALISLWAASKGIMGLERGLHVIYHVTEKENYVIRRLRCTLYTFIFIITIILALGLLVLGQTLEGLLSENFSFLSQITRVILAFRVLLVMGVFIAAFTLGYKYLTGVHCTFLEALPGVLLSTIGWMIFSFGYSIYMTNFSQYTSLYGSLGALILLFLWIYFCILILMVGAEINVYLKEKQEKTAS